MKAPLLIFIITAVAMIILGLSRRNHLLSGLLAGLFSVIIAIFILNIPLDEALSVFGASIRFDGRWFILGRSFILNQTNRASIGYVYLSGGFILAGAWSARPVRMYYALAMGILGLVAASLMINPFLFAAIFIELAVICATLILSSREEGQYRGGLRLLSLYTLAMLTILLGGWIIDVSDAGFEMEGLNTSLALIMGFGFATLISIPPFHSWLPIAAEENHPFTWTFIGIVLQGAALFFIVRFLSSFTWLNENELVYPFIRSVGATMALVSSLWAVVQKDFNKMASYALIADQGVMLVALGVGTEEGFQLALGLTGARVISMACLSQGLMEWWGHRRSTNSKESEVVPGLTLFSSAAIFVGMLSLAGFPITAGFPGRWGLLSVVASLDHYAWIAIVGSMGILGVAAIRSAMVLFIEEDTTYSIILDWKRKIFLGGSLFLTLLLGIFPQLLFPWIIKALEGITFPLI